MYKELSKVREFHEAFGVPIRKEPGFPGWDRRLLRLKLETEELTELEIADGNNDLAGVADAIGDLIYVLLGRCLEYGIPIQSIFDSIHESNMSKLSDNGTPVYRADGKVLKGPHFHPPNIAQILDIHGYTKPNDSSDPNA